MAHDSNKILMGTHGSSDFLATCENGDPATFPAGTAVRKASNGDLSLASGSLIGVSLGASLSDNKKTSVARSGNFIPVLLTDESGFAYVVIGEAVEVSATTGLAVSSGVPTGAIYVSGPKKGIVPGSAGLVDVAYIDMPGGL